MKRLLKPSLIITVALFLFAWGSVGHKTIAVIAEHHLTLEGKAGIKALLGDESLADVSNWADQVKRQPDYKGTASWHFLNLPLGVSYNQFTQTVKRQAEPNLYTAIKRCISELQDNKLSIQERSDALKFIVHLVGDAHQPFHVSRREDKGGNTIQVRFDDRGTNLHALWDTKLIDHQHLSYEQMAKEYDTATPQQIRQWQSDDIMQWLWESYQLSSKFYKEVNAVDNLGDAYYNVHIGIIKQRIEMAGIRLAGLLNNTFKNGQSEVTIVSPPDVSRIEPKYKVTKLEDLGKHVDDTINVFSRVTGIKLLKHMALVDMGGVYPNQLLTIVLKGATVQFATEMKDRRVSVTGKLVKFKDKFEIVVTDPQQLEY